ncbi:MAG: DUF1566 domain-containing protein [Campylobacterota bacterium]|nr:DUF1566 domain-containing protein [Campylobacterota bacterium]
MQLKLKTLIFSLLVLHSSLLSSVYTDKSTGLMWQDNYDAKSVKKTWSGAKKYCQNLSLSGYKDWFLPAAEQLLTLTDKSKYNPSIKNGIQNITSSSYWSSSPDVSSSSSAWGVGFKYGHSDYNGKTDKFYVRCARAGQSDTLTFGTSKSANGFNKIVEKFIKQELKSIPKPPANLKLIKDMFETTAEFEARVKKTKASQKSVIAEYKRKVSKAKIEAKKKAIKKALQYTWGKPTLSNLTYDADNGYFVANLSFEAKKSFSKKVAIKVPRENARGFYSKKDSLKPQAIFDYDGKSVTLKDIKVPYKYSSYLAQFTHMSIDDTRVAVNIVNEFDTPSNISTNISVAKNSVSSFDASKLIDYKALDKMLAKTSQARLDNKKWLFTVGIEQYEYTDNISYASRSAKMFKKVMKKKLGIKESNCFTMINSGATQAKIKTSLKKMLRRVKSGDTIYFYYNGHGVPVPSKKFEPYMLTSDTEPDFVADESFFSLKNIYGKLSGSKAAKVVAVVDSCFSGVTDGKAVLKGVAATKMRAKTVAFDKDKMVVLSAGKSHQYSNGYDKKGHRLFSFYIMQNILEGDKTIKSLYKDTKKETYQTSIEEYGDSRTQEPTIEGNFRLKL